MARASTYAQMRETQRERKRQEFQAAKHAFEALPRAEQEAIRAEFPPMSEGFARDFDSETVAIVRRYNALREIVNVSVPAQLAELRALKARAIERTSGA